MLLGTALVYGLQRRPVIVRVSLHPSIGPAHAAWFRAEEPKKEGWLVSRDRRQLRLVVKHKKDTLNDEGKSAVHSYHNVSSANQSFLLCRVPWNPHRSLNIPKLLPDIGKGIPDAKLKLRLQRYSYSDPNDNPFVKQITLPRSSFPGRARRGSRAQVYTMGEAWTP